MTSKATTKPKKKRGPGRPPVAEKKLSQVLKLMGEGRTKTWACGAADIGVSTVDDKEDSDPEFAKRLWRARLRGAWARNDFANDQSREIYELAKAGKVSHEAISAVRELLHQARWESSKLLPKTFGDRLAVDMQAEVTAKPKEMDDTELARTYLFAASEWAKEAPEATFINAVAISLEMAADAIRHRGGGSRDPRLYRGNEPHASLADCIQEVAALVRKRLTAPAALPEAPKLLPAPPDIRGVSRAREDDDLDDAVIL